MKRYLDAGQAFKTKPQKPVKAVLSEESRERDFLAWGFKSASLRSAVRSAGVMTRAFYGYYDSKEGLFEALNHEMPLEQAIACLEEMRPLYTAGWMKIMGSKLYNFFGRC